MCNSAFLLHSFLFRLLLLLISLFSVVLHSTALFYCFTFTLLCHYFLFISTSYPPSFFPSLFFPILFWVLAVLLLILDIILFFCSMYNRMNMKNYPRSSCLWLMKQLLFHCQLSSLCLVHTSSSLHPLLMGILFISSCHELVWLFLRSPAFSNDVLLR